MGSKAAVDGDCSHAIKRHVLLKRKAMTNLGTILKSRDTPLLIKFHIVYDFFQMDVRVGP